jgi:UDP-N-acetylmuramate dehydrogenase
LSASLLISSDKIVSFPSSWFKFGYRTSILKYQKNEAPPVVLKVIFQLQRRRKENVLEEIAKYKKWREIHQPLGEKTCGSIFKNPAQTDNIVGTSLKEKSAGYLLEQVGAKKLRVGDARVSKKHANWIINAGQAKAIDVRTLIEKMRGLVEDNFKIILKEEIEYLGVWNEENYISASGDYRKN